MCVSLRTDGAPAMFGVCKDEGNFVLSLQYGESWHRRLDIVVKVVTQAVYFIRSRSFNNLSSQILVQILKFTVLLGARSGLLGGRSVTFSRIVITNRKFGRQCGV